MATKKKATKKQNNHRERITSVDRREMFCYEYCSNGFNATQAAISAGYSEKTAASAASRLLSDVKIISKISYIKSKMIDDKVQLGKRVIAELEKLSFADIRNVISWNEHGAVFLKDSNEIDPSYSATIESLSFKEDGTGVSSKLKMHSKIPALKLLGTYAEVLTDKVEHSGEVKGGQTMIYLPENNRDDSDNGD